ncbi:MAG: hypothetical protein AAF125_00335 [Chloroflexota bacterium]
MPILQGLWRRISRGLWWIIAIAAMLLLLRNSTTQFGDPYYALSAQIQDAHFDYIGWELGAITAKAGQAAAGTHAYLSEAERADYVRMYVEDLAAVQQIEAEIQRIYTDPAADDPESATADLRAERDAIRADLRSRQTMTESIVESQVSAMLIDEGFGFAGQIFPPVWMRFTQRTMLLVASPRDTIEMRHAYTVEPIPVDERARIETAIMDEENLSSVMVPIGGMALYPAMIVETTSIPWMVETFAHEWFHHYLMFYPLGWETEYFSSGEARIINETAASIFGREVARKVLERYYPDLVPPEPIPTTTAQQQAETQTAPEPDFRYDREMNITRVKTDQLLAKGLVEEAETYMEARRELFVSQGYNIRVLNQAWFSFYGGYQVAGISAGGEDPTGPAVQKLRDKAESLYAWTVLMRGITSREALLAVAET